MMNFSIRRNRLSVLVILLLAAGLSIARASESDEFDAKAEQYKKDDSQYHLIEDKDSKAELAPAVKRYEQRKSAQTDDQYILGGQNVKHQDGTAKDALDAVDSSH
jgi:hypothetical protein